MQKEHTIKPEQDSKVEKTTLTAALSKVKGQGDYSAHKSSIISR